MDFTNLMNQFAEENEVSAILKTDHEALLNELKGMIPRVNEMSQFALTSGNTFASRKYSALSSDLLKAVSELESTRV